MLFYPNIVLILITRKNEKEKNDRRKEEKNTNTGKNIV